MRGGTGEAHLGADARPRPPRRCGAAPSLVELVGCGTSCVLGLLNGRWRAYSHHSRTLSGVARWVLQPEDRPRSGSFLPSQLIAPVSPTRLYPASFRRRSSRSVLSPLAPAVRRSTRLVDHAAPWRRRATSRATPAASMKSHTSMGRGAHPLYFFKQYSYIPAADGGGCGVEQDAAAGRSSDR